MRPEVGGQGRADRGRFVPLLSAFSDEREHKCTEAAAREMSMRSLYEHAGGDDALHRLEELFYSKVLADPILKSLFPEPRPRHVDHLTWFTAESFGGPDRFSRELGFQYII